MQVEYAGFLFMPGERVGPGRNGSACEVSEVPPMSDGSGDEASGLSLAPSSPVPSSVRSLLKLRQEQHKWCM